MVHTPTRLSLPSARRAVIILAWILAALRASFSRSSVAHSFNMWPQIPHGKRSRLINRASASLANIADMATADADGQVEIGPCKAADVEDAKAALLRFGMRTGRGALARPAERERAERLVQYLENMFPIRKAESNDHSADGLWELAFSDVQPFQASAFFLALATAVESKIKLGASDGSLAVHRLATSISEVGRVAHQVEGGVLRSLVELKVGLVPSLPLAVAGTVISTGQLSGSVAAGRLSLTLRNTTVQESAIRYGLPMNGGLQPGEDRSLLSFIGDQLVPSGDIFASVLGEIPEVVLEPTFVDKDILIWRTPGINNHFFVFERSDTSSWSALKELEQRAAGAQTSLLGSSFALGMLNPFISRRLR